MPQLSESGGPAFPPNTTTKTAPPPEISGLSRWQSAFAEERKDHRYYELLEDTLRDGFKYGYLKIENDHAVHAIQPYFLLDQDLLAGLGGYVTKFVARIRRAWPRFMFARTMMVGCTAGEGHLEGDEASQLATAETLARSLPQLAREMSCAMIVLKEFPA